MRFEWDTRKNRSNRAKHGVGFNTAEQVFADPLTLFRLDRFVEAEERWHAVGVTHAGVLLVVAFAYRQHDEQEAIRIISARKADRFERRAYEEGY